MEARVAAPAMFDGSPITLSPNPIASAEQMRLVVKDASGNIVQSEALAVSSAQIEWAGVDQTGAPLPNGKYSFEIESVSAGSVINTAPVEVYTEIKEVRGENGTTVVITESGTSITIDAISAVRRAE